jgi:hypothetical protein
MAMLMNRDFAEYGTVFAVRGESDSEFYQKSGSCMNRRKQNDR